MTANHIPDACSFGLEDPTVKSSDSKISVSAGLDMVYKSGRPSFFARSFAEVEALPLFLIGESSSAPNSEGAFSLSEITSPSSISLPSAFASTYNSPIRINGRYGGLLKRDVRTYTGVAEKKIGLTRVGPSVDFQQPKASRALTTAPGERYPGVFAGSIVLPFSSKIAN